MPVTYPVVQTFLFDVCFLYGYTLGMKTAVSLPDPLFQEAENLARTLRKSRSQLYREAIEEYLARHDPERITEQIDRLCVDAGDPSDPFVSAATARTLHDSEW